MRLSELKQRVFKIWQSEPGLIKLCLALLLANSAIVLVMTILVSPKILHAERNIIRLQDEVRGVDTSRSKSPQQLYVRAGEDLQMVYERIPSREELSDLVLEISNLASWSGFDIESVSYDPERDKDLDLLVYSLSFTVNGSYRQLKKFVHLLEASERIVVLNSVQLIEGDGSSVAMRIKITTYFRNEVGA